MLRRIRLMLVRQRTLLSNAIRAHMAEFGIVAPIGAREVAKPQALDLATCGRE
jgi:transposase